MLNKTPFEHHMCRKFGKSFSTFVWSNTSSLFCKMVCQNFWGFLGGWAWRCGGAIWNQGGKIIQICWWSSIWPKIAVFAFLEFLSWGFQQILFSTKFHWNCSRKVNRLSLSRELPFFGSFPGFQNCSQTVESPPFWNPKLTNTTSPPN